MFDELVADAGRASGGVAVGAWARVENAACARRLTAMLSILDALQSADGSADRGQWCIDNWAAVCAEVGAAQQVTSETASNQLWVAMSLRDRLPRVAAVFAEGLVTYRMASTMVWRTALITDPDARRTVDGALARAVAGWEPMSEAKTVAAIDYWVEKYDPHALRRGPDSGPIPQCGDQL